MQEKPTGSFAALWQKKLGDTGCALVDVSSGLADAMGVKDDGEVKNVKKAAYLVSSAVNTFAVPQLEGGRVPLATLHDAVLVIV